MRQKGKQEETSKREDIVFTVAVSMGKHTNWEVLKCRMLGNYTRTTLQCSFQRAYANFIKKTKHVNKNRLLPGRNGCRKEFDVPKH